MDNEWLSLRETAELLGVHPATVRVWGDKGELPMQRTPGGHRRFSRTAVELRAADHRAQLSGAQMVIQSMLGRARLELMGGGLRNEAWYGRLSAEARQKHGQIGHQLLQITVQYLSGQLSDAEVKTAAFVIGREYEQLGRETGLTLTETTRAYLYFREFLSQTIYDMANATGTHGPTDWGALRRQIIFLTNEVLLAIIDTHEGQTNE